MEILLWLMNPHLGCFFTPWRFPCIFGRGISSLLLVKSPIISLTLHHDMVSRFKQVFLMVNSLVFVQITIRQANPFPPASLPEKSLHSMIQWQNRTGKSSHATGTPNATAIEIPNSMNWPDTQRSLEWKSLDLNPRLLKSQAFSGSKAPSPGRSLEFFASEARDKVSCTGASRDSVARLGPQRSSWGPVLC